MHQNYEQAPSSGYGFKTKKKCKFYGVDCNPCNSQCKYIHLSDVEQANKSSHEIEKKDARTKNYDKENVVLFNNNIIQTFSTTFRKVTPLLIKSAGVVLYSLQNGKVKILLGYEKNHGAYKLFGGMRDVKIDKNSIDTAVRECCEEVYGAFGKNYDIGNCMKVLKSFVKTQNPLWNKYSENGKFLLLLIRTKHFPCVEIKKAEKFHKSKTKKDKFFTNEKSDYSWVDYKKLIANSKLSISGLKRVGTVKQFDHELLKNCGKAFSVILTKQVTEFKPVFPKYNGAKHNSGYGSKKKGGSVGLLNSTVTSEFMKMEKENLEMLKEIKEGKVKIKNLQGAIGQFSKRAKTLEDRLEKKDQECKMKTIALTRMETARDNLLKENKKLFAMNKKIESENKEMEKRYHLIKENTQKKENEMEFNRIQMVKVSQVKDVISSNLDKALLEIERREKLEMEINDRVERMENEIEFNRMEALRNSKIAKEKDTEKDIILTNLKKKLQESEEREKQLAATIRELTKMKIKKE